MHANASAPSAAEAFDELAGLVGGLAVMLLPLLVGLPGALLLALVVLVTAPLVILAGLAVCLPICGAVAVVRAAAR